MLTSTLLITSKTSVLVFAGKAGNILLIAMLAKRDCGARNSRRHDDVGHGQVQSEADRPILVAARLREYKNHDIQLRDRP